ncbi:MAG TPA: AraC family transcriptional regulator, partial [Pseudomonadales bacterium]
AFNGVISFNAQVPSIRMPIAWFALRSPLADAALHNLVVGHLESERRRLESGNHLEARVEVLLAAAGDAGLSLPQLAERLNLSRRTLVRRLNGAGTSFGKLIDRHQMRRAEVLLRDREFSASEVAYQLGYSDPANFTRAFKRWFGETPGVYRERLRASSRRLRTERPNEHSKPRSKARPLR